MSIDILIRAAAIYSMDNQRAVYRALAIGNDRIAAVSVDPCGLDYLVRPATQVIDEPGLTVLPAFLDNHNHLSEASRNSLFVAVGKRRTSPSSTSSRTAVWTSCAAAPRLLVNSRALAWSLPSDSVEPTKQWHSCAAASPATAFSITRGSTSRSRTCA